MSIKAKVEAIIYAAEEPITFAQIFALVKDEAQQELLARQAQAYVSPETAAAIIPAEDDRESNLAAEPTAAPQPDLAMEAPAPAETVLPGPAPEWPLPVAPISAAEPQPITEAEMKSAVRAVLEELVTDYSACEHGIEIRQIAGGYRMATKPEHHDLVRAFAKSLKPPVRLSLQALETLAVIAYKQPITAPEISEIRGVDSGGVLGTLLDRKLITTAGRKQVVGRPILYKTTREFLLRFGLKDVGELPSMEEFEKLAADSLAGELFAQPTPEQLAAQVAMTEAPAPADEVPTVEPATFDPHTAGAAIAQQLSAEPATEPISEAELQDEAAELPSAEPENEARKTED
jgi:segregation and condensation protein B